MNDINGDRNGGMKARVDDEEEKRTMETIREFSEDLDAVTHRNNPDDATPASRTGTGTSDKGGINMNSSTGLDTNKTGVSADDRNGSMDPNNSTGLTTDKTSVNSDGMVGLNTNSSTANSPESLGNQKAESGSFGNNSEGNS